MAFHPLPGFFILRHRSVFKTGVRMEEKDLLRRISELQTRIKVLEERVVSTERRQSMLPEYPQTALLSPNFLTRAFAVLGHYIVAGLIITIPIYVIMFIILLAVGVHFGSM
jgi:hypothetical protein